MLESQEVTENRQQLMICDLPPALLVSDNLIPQELERHHRQARHEVRVCLGHIDREIHLVLDAVIAAGRKPHEVGTSGPAFGHVAEGLLDQLLLILSVIPNPLQIAGICCAAFAMYALSK